MLQRWTNLLATSAALTAILLGLARHWEFWSVVKRATAAYLVMYGIVGVFFVLTRLAMRFEPSGTPDTTRNGRERRTTNGTDTADSL